MSVGALEEVVLQNSSQFYRWHTELEAARTLETEQKYRNYADALKGHLTSCNHLLEKVLLILVNTCTATIIATIFQCLCPHWTLITPG